MFGGRRVSGRRRRVERSPHARGNTAQSRSGVPRRTRRQIPTHHHDLRTALPLVGGADRGRHRGVPGARRLGHHRPFPRAHPARASDRLRSRHRVLRLRRVDVARRAPTTWDDATTAAEPRFVLLAVISSFVLAELGDKTMLATVALASDHHWAGVWIGATVGMVLADGVAIAVGRLLHQRLPERFLHVLASLLFLLFGLWMLFDNALGWPMVASWSPARRRRRPLVAAVAAVRRRRRRSYAARAESSTRHVLTSPLRGHSPPVASSSRNAESSARAWRAPGSKLRRPHRPASADRCPVTLEFPVGTTAQPRCAAQSTADLVFPLLRTMRLGLRNRASACSAPLRIAGPCARQYFSAFALGCRHNSRYDDQQIPAIR